MTPRIAKIFLWGVGVIVAVTVAAMALVPDIDVRIPERTVREAIDDHVPLNYGSGSALEISVRSAKVDFLGDDDVGGVRLETDVKLSGFGLAGSGSAKTTTSVRYEGGAFYLSEMALDDFEVKPSLATRAKLAAWKKAWSKFLDEIEADIRTREGDDALAEFKDIRRTFGPVVRDALDESLGDIPVYRLQGGPAQYAVLLVLKDIRFTDTEAIATLSPAQGILIIATGLILALVAGLFIWAWVQDTRRRNGYDSNDY